MGAELLLMILIAVACVLLALVVALRNPKSETNRALAAFTVCIVAWNIGLYQFHQRGNPFHAIFWGRFVFAVTFFTGLFLVRFAVAFPKRAFRVSMGRLLILISVGCLSAISLFTNLILADVEFLPYGTNFTPGLLYPLFVCYMIACSVGSLSILFQKYRNSQGIARMQFKYLFLGFFIAGVITLFTNLFWPSITGQNHLAQYGPYSMIILLGFTSYAIVKHRLMDIKLVVASSVSYSILLFAICGLFISLVYYLQSGYAKALPVNPNVLFVVAGFVVAFGFQPLRRFLEKATDRIFFKGRYDPQELLARFSEVMISTIVLDPLMDFILKTMRNEVRISKVALVLLTKNNQITETRMNGFEISTASFGKVVDLCPARKTVVTDELEEESKERQLLRELDISVVLPLVSGDNLEAVLILGDKKSGDMFTAQDLQFLELLAPEVAIAIKNALLFEERNQRVLELSALNKLAFSLGSGLDLKTILDQAIEQAILVTEADSGSVMLLDEENQTLAIEASKGIKREVLEKTRIRIGEGIAGWVVEKKEPLILVDGLDPRFQKELKREDIVSSLTVPLKAKEKVIGVLNINRKTSEKIFSKEDLDVMTTFAAEVAVSIENAKLYRDLQNTFLGTISALAAAVDAKDHYTSGHSKNVTELAVVTAKEISLAESEVETIRIASALHDIGKIGIDGSILNKPGKLDSKEREIINLHPTISANILKSLEFLKDVVPLILFHHERFDGTGYPTKISGNAIPIGARIIAVADSFNAMVSERPYRKAMSLEAAIKELKDNAGSQFDPDVVKAFLRVLARTGLKKKGSESSPLETAVTKK